MAGECIKGIGMINMKRPLEIWCIIGAVDMRRGAQGLSQLVQTLLQKTPCDGTAYAFCNRRGTCLKLLIWDGTGVWCCTRRLHRGAFVWPSGKEASWVLSGDQWEWLIAGVDWQRLNAAPPAHWHV
jgi:transposase